MEKLWILSFLSWHNLSFVPNRTGQNLAVRPKPSSPSHPTGGGRVNAGQRVSAGHVVRFHLASVGRTRMDISGPVEAEPDRSNILLIFILLFISILPLPHRQKKAKRRLKKRSNSTKPKPNPSITLRLTYSLIFHFTANEVSLSRSFLKP
jgi:hypothetical protein